MVGIHQEEERKIKFLGEVNKRDKASGVVWMMTDLRDVFG